MDSISLSNAPVYESGSARALVALRLPAPPTDLDEVIPAADERDLLWYFKAGGIAVFSTSTFGTQLERAEMAFGGRECGRCRGTGYLRSRRAWRAVGEHERAIRKWMGQAAARKLPSLRDTPCKDCKGSGWLPGRKRRPRGPITAQLTGSSVPLHSGGVTVSDVGVARLGSVSAHLDRMRMEWAPGPDVLAAYYDDDARQMKSGRLVAVWPQTPAGKTLLRGAPDALPPLQALDNIRAKNADRPEPRVTALIDAANDQAAALYRQAARAWNATGSIARAVRLRAVDA